MKNERAPAKEIECKWCNKMVSTYNISTHIKLIHANIGTIDDYVEKFGEFRKNKSPKKDINTTKVKCEICSNEFSSIGMATHLKNAHALTVDQYITEGYSEFRSKYLDYNERSKHNDFKCHICNSESFASHQHLAHHINKAHDVDMEDYIVKYIFKDKLPICKCGCGNEVKIKLQPPYHSEFLSGHNTAERNRKPK